MWWCGDVLMCWCVDVLMCWCADVVMCWCADLVMCWCVDVLVCWWSEHFDYTYFPRRVAERSRSDLEDWEGHFDFAQCPECSVSGGSVSGHGDFKTKIVLRWCLWSWDLRQFQDNVNRFHRRWSQYFSIDWLWHFSTEGLTPPGAWFLFCQKVGLFPVVCVEWKVIHIILCSGEVHFD